MPTLDEMLTQLVMRACSHPRGSHQRQQSLTVLICLIHKSGKLWKEAVSDYEDALQQTWLYFCRNLCESITADPYDPSQSSVITWLNSYLKRRLQDSYQANRDLKDRTVTIGFMTHDRTSTPFDLIDNLPAPADCPPWLDDIQSWVTQDRDYSLRRTHIRDRPDVNCQVLILRRLPPETSWKQLSEEFNLPIATLSSFYQRQCLPKLRAFGQAHGYL